MRATFATTFPLGRLANLILASVAVASCSNAAPSSTTTPKPDTGTTPDTSVGTSDAGDTGTSTSETGGETGSGPTLTAATFAPQGCTYTVKAPAVQDYPPFEADAPTLGTAPTPKHVRLGLGGDVHVGQTGYADPSTSFAVGWQTDSASMPSQIMVGTSASALTQTLVGFSVLVPAELSDGPSDGIRYHYAHVCGLTAGRTYYYQVGGAGNWSPVATITTAPAKGGTDPVTIGVAGDSRSETSDYSIWTSITTRMKSVAVPMVLFSGDPVDVGAFESEWDGWSTAGDAYAASAIIAAAPGNHDNEDEHFFASSVLPGGGNNPQRFASWDYGPVHIVEMDSYYGIIDTSDDNTGDHAELLAWLAADLAAANANRANVPWIVAYHHHPVYSSTDQTDRAAERALTLAAFGPLFDQYGVDIDFVGHDHFYEKSKPINAGAVVAPGKGTLYVIDGAAGADAYSFVNTLATSDVRVAYDPTKGQGIYGILTATMHTLKMNTYMISGPGGTSPTDDGTPIDTISLSR